MIVARRVDTPTQGTEPWLQVRDQGFRAGYLHILAPESRLPLTSKKETLFVRRIFRCHSESKSEEQRYRWIGVHQKRRSCWILGLWGLLRSLGNETRRTRSILLRQCG